jgi:hypothetical protein
MNQLKYFILLIAGWVLVYLTSNPDADPNTEIARMDGEMYFCMIVITTVCLGGIFIRHDRKKGV